MRSNSKSSADGVCSAACASAYRGSLAGGVWTENRRANVAYSPRRQAG